MTEPHPTSSDADSPGTDPAPEAQPGPDNEAPPGPDASLPPDRGRQEDDLPSRGTGTHASRAWTVLRTLMVFAMGLGVGFALGGGRGGPRVIYSGAMTEMEGRTAYGPEEAPVTIVEYTDYQCGFCQRYNQQILPDILATYDGEIRYLIRHFPLLQIHPAAGRAAQAAVCAERQGELWAYHEILFQQEEGLSPESLLAYADQVGLEADTFQSCLESRESAEVVRDDLERGAAYGVRGTPAFFINGRVIFGAQPLEAFKRTIDAALEEARGD